MMNKGCPDLYFLVRCDIMPNFNQNDLRYLQHIQYRFEKIKDAIKEVEMYCNIIQENRFGDYSRKMEELTRNILTQTKDYEIDFYPAEIGKVLLYKDHCSTEENERDICFCEECGKTEDEVILFQYPFLTLYNGEYSEHVGEGLDESEREKEPYTCFWCLSKHMEELEIKDERI
jgi:hypothetical protein